jgi:hypothetical protein
MTRTRSKVDSGDGRPRRLSPQMQQENVSWGQLQECLADWNCNSLKRDIGEDFHVGILDDGRSTGLTFLVQLKSVTDWRPFVRVGHADEVHYRIEVGDLEHWEA